MIVLIVVIVVIVVIVTLKSKDELRSESVTRSPIELSWTAKNYLLKEVNLTALLKVGEAEQETLIGH